MNRSNLGFPRTRVVQRGGMVDPGPARKHLDRLRGVGMTDQMIARAAGVTQPTVRSLRIGRYETVARTTAVAVLGVSPRPTRQQSLVLAFGAARRIQALMLMGWSQGELADRAGMHRRQLPKLLHATRIDWETHCVIDGLFRALWDRDGGNVRARLWAQRQGWAPALAWDDIDDYWERPKFGNGSQPSAVRDEVEAQRAVRRARVAELSLEGLTAPEISRVLGVSERSVKRDRRRLRETA